MRSTYYALILICSYVFCTAVVGTHAVGAPEDCPQRFLQWDLEKSGYEPVIAALDDLAFQVQQGRIRNIYIVACAPTEWNGRPFRHAAMVRNYLLESRGLPADRVHVQFVDRCDLSTTEIWTGDTAPAFAKPSGLDLRYLELPHLYDEYYDVFTKELSWVAEEDEPARLSAFANVLNRHPDLIGYLVGYAGTPARGYIGERLSGAQFAARERAWLEGDGGVSKGRLFVVDGGRQVVAGIQLWLTRRESPVTQRLLRRHRPRWLKRGG